MSSSKGATVSDVAQQHSDFNRRRRATDQMFPLNSLPFVGSSAMKAVNAKTRKLKHIPILFLILELSYSRGSLRLGQTGGCKGVLQHKTRQQHTVTGRSVGRYGTVVS